MLLNIIIVLGTFILVNFAYQKDKQFKIVVDDLTKLTNWGLYILTALVAVVIIYLTQS